MHGNMNVKFMCQLVFTYRKSALRFEERFLRLLVLQLASLSFGLENVIIVILCGRSACYCYQGLPCQINGIACVIRGAQFGVSGTILSAMNWFSHGNRLYGNHPASSVSFQRWSLISHIWPSYV
jgi:hypothetical protein